MGNEIGAAVAVEPGTNRYVSVHDQRGSVAESYRYDAYGNVKVYDSTQSETGLIKLGRRCYDPTFGRFVTAGHRTQPSQTAHEPDGH